MDRSGLVRYDFYRGPQQLGSMWTVNRDGLEMRCAIATHRVGWELRLYSGKNFLRSQVCKSEEEVFRVSDAWNLEARSKGWT